ncbi:LysR family transcriptional regulator [Chromohalobacter nigrandesensis]|uniref:LysR family transcriptional regulator n=1 Tax=Chromohalobacter nigrandesensis TaxID=119863 RepID=UPI001FF4D624|nr:LysR family transcriptional regulator [Chromohalobacter nigrandesensis]MCK0746262.1 LysR family transcriptional regulator [Chromohalobacter nigrandesensis]
MAIFVRVADLGSFTATAAEFGLSTQMVSKHVIALEQRLGARLLHRTTRRQNLTEIGRIYHERSQAILAEVEAAETLTEQARTTPRGCLRVNAPVTFGSQGLVGLLTRYLREYPEVEIDLTLSDRVVDPIEEGYDAVIRLGPVSDSTTLVARPLTPYRLIACASPAYLKERGEPETPADLAKHECLGFSYWSGTLGSQWCFSRDGYAYHAPVSGRLHINDWKGLLNAALEGFGITLGYETALAEELSAGRLIRLLPDYDGPMRPMYLLYAADQRMTPKLRHFIDDVVKEFA